MLVGITGGIGSGKTTVVKMFAKFKDVVIYNADVQAKLLMNTSQEIREKLIEEFSENVYVKGELNRKFLADIVFNDKNKLAILNSIVHPVVHNHLLDFVKINSSKTYVLYENAILFENFSDQLCNSIITVTAPIETRIERVIKRDKCTKEEVISRMNNQWSDAKKIIQSNYVIENLNLKSTEDQVFDIHKKLTYKR